MARGDTYEDIIVTAKIPNPKSGVTNEKTYSLLLKCVTPVPQFFANLSQDIEAVRRAFQANTESVDLQPLVNGFLLQAEKFSALQDVCARIWRLNLIESISLREFGLWDVEVLKHARDENPSLLIRGANLLCEKVINRKKLEACKSKSD